MPPDFAGPWPPEADLPQVGFKEPPDHHEAYWLYGYDPASKVGHYLYLAAEKDDLLLRRESVFMLLPDGSVLAQHGAGRGSHGRTAAGDRLRLECLEPFRRWRGRYAGQVHRLAGDEIVAGPQPGSELVEAVVDDRGRVRRRALEHRGRLGRAAAVAALPPVLRRARHRHRQRHRLPVCRAGFPQPLPAPPRHARFHRPRHHQRALPQRPRLRPAALPGDRRPPGARPRLPLPRRRRARRRRRHLAAPRRGGRRRRAADDRAARGPAQGRHQRGDDRERVRHPRPRGPYVRRSRRATGPGR